MQIIDIPQDINSMYIQAASFPHGVRSAHKQLRAKLPDDAKRRFFAISWSDEKGGIIYRAAAEELQKGEAASLGLATFTIRKEKYISVTLTS